MHQTFRRHSRGHGAGWAAMLLASTTWPVVGAVADNVSPPRTRATVLQWMPVEGQYTRMELMSVDIVLNAVGSATVPIIGSVDTNGSEIGETGTDVAAIIRSELGFPAPEVEVDLTEFPPVYVVVPADKLTPMHDLYPHRETSLELLAEVVAGTASSTFRLAMGAPLVDFTAPLPGHVVVTLSPATLTRQASAS